MQELKRITVGSLLLSTQEVKDALRLTDDEPELPILMRSVQDLAEVYTRRSFTATTYELRLDTVGDLVALPRPPIASITKIETFDADDVATTINVSTYYLVDDSRLLFTTVPDISRDYGGIVITYVSGDASQTPASVKTGMLKAISTAYENREDYVTGTIVATLPANSTQYLDTWRVLC